MVVCMLKIRLVKYQNLMKSLNMVFNELMHGAIIVIDAKLTPQEEAFLIQEAMKLISERFSGIEIGSVHLSQLKGGAFDGVRQKLAERMLGKKMGITIIGPSNIIRSIERSGEELQLHF